MGRFWISQEGYRADRPPTSEQTCSIWQFFLRPIFDGNVDRHYRHVRRTTDRVRRARAMSSEVSTNGEVNAEPDFAVLS